MLPNRSPAVLAGLAASLLVTLSACANSSAGNAFKNSLAADPRLQESAGNVGRSGNEASTGTTANRPADFPAEIPIYPESQLQDLVPVASPTPTAAPTTGTATPAASSAASPSAKGQAQWTSGDPSNAVQNFYLQQFQTNGWQLVNQATQDLPATLIARRNNLQVTVTIAPTATLSPPISSTPTSTTTPIPSSSATSTVFTINYAYGGSSAVPADNAEAANPQPGDPDFVGPVPTSTPASIAASSTTPSSVAPSPQGFTDLDKAPKELRSYVKDLAQLGVLPLRSSNTKSATSNNTTLFEPNKTITRREYARWLVTANNRIYSDRTGQQ
ncbi:MAG TPA: S-layer homology domain-containing protein, partial [Candidatus Obscuribacterales bacterium]